MGWWMVELKVLMSAGEWVTRWVAQSDIHLVEWTGSQSVAPWESQMAVNLVDTWGHLRAALWAGGTAVKWD